MTNFFSTLDERARRTGSLLCVGLDPHPADLPESTPAAALEFCLKLMSATADAALAFKPNAAFFEAWGAPGWAALAVGSLGALVLSFVLALAVGLFSLRVRAIFFAMITLAVAAAFQTLSPRPA